jgi:magnesium-transporting ATPase (P-type)
MCKPLTFHLRLSPPAQYRQHHQGLVDTVAFDKTGTLTESGLELRELRLATDGRFHTVTLSRGSAPATPAPPPAAEEGGGSGACEEGGAPRADGGGTGLSVDVPRAVRVLLAACHGLAVVDGALAGDQLEIKLFEASGWSCLGEQSEAAGQIGVGAAARDRRPGEGLEGAAAAGGAGEGAGGGMVVVSPCGERCRVVRRFDFTSARQRSSVVVTHGDGSLAVYAKVGWGKGHAGAPRLRTVVSLC